MMRKIKFVLLFLIFFLLNISIVSAAEIIKTCRYEEDYIGAYIHFWDDGTVTGAQYFDGHQLDQERAIETYMDDVDDVVNQFNENHECPSYIVSYRVTDLGLNFGVVRYRFFFDEESKDAFINDYDTWYTEAYSASLTSSSGDEDDPENNVGENEVLYSKTYQSLISNSLGDVTFRFKYNTVTENYTQQIMSFSNSEVNPIIIDTSIEHFKTSVLDKARENQFPESVYCGTIASYLLVSNDAVIVSGGGEINNGDVVCSFDRNLFLDSTNRLIRYHNPDYGNTEQPDDDNNQGFNPNGLCSGENCNISLALFCNDGNVARTLKFIGLAFFIAKILVPAIIIIVGIVDLIKVITSGKEEDMKKHAKNIGMRVVIGVLIFLLPSIIDAVYDVASDIVSNGGTSAFDNCEACLMTPNSDACYVEESD